MPVTNSGVDVGVISNYMSNDSSNIFQFFTMMHYLWAVPIKVNFRMQIVRWGKLRNFEFVLLDCSVAVSSVQTDGNQCSNR